MVTDDDKRRILLKIREILSSKDNWTKGEAARDASGEYVGVLSPSACSFCLTGAFYRAEYLVTRRTTASFAGSWLDRRHRMRFPDWPGDAVDWNDDPATTHDDIIAFLEN